MHLNSSTGAVAGEDIATVTLGKLDVMVDTVDSNAFRPKMETKPSLSD